MTYLPSAGSSAVAYCSNVLRHLLRSACVGGETSSLVEDGDRGATCSQLRGVAVCKCRQHTQSNQLEHRVGAERSGGHNLELPALQRYGYMHCLLGDCACAHFELTERRSGVIDVARHRVRTVPRLCRDPVTETSRNPRTGTCEYLYEYEGTSNPYEPTPAVPKGPEATRLRRRRRNRETAKLTHGCT